MNQESNIENSVLQCNRQAMESMHSNNYPEAIRLLQKANLILTNLTPTYSVIKLKAVTLNNLGCLYKRANDNQKALNYLTQALSYEKRLPDEYTNMAGTYLNLCAIRSHLNDHDEALDLALKAINIIQRNPNSQSEFTTTLVAAYHNAGVEYQYLNRRIEAQNFFRQGFDLASKKLGRTHELTKSIEAYVARKENSSESFSVKPASKYSKEETLFRPESEIFNEDISRKINVDTTPWPKYSEKKSWPARIEPIEATPKPFGRRQEASQQSLVGVTDRSARLPKALSEKPRPSNVHLHHHEERTPKPSFKITSKPQPSLSPSKASSSKTIDSSPPKAPSLTHLNQLITSEKISAISFKLESLQQKLNTFEQTYKDLHTLNEESESSSIISTVSLVNNRRQQAALMIQKNFKKYMMRKRFKEMKSAAVCIQKVKRGNEARRKVRRERFKVEDFSQQVDKDPVQEPIMVKVAEKCNQTEGQGKKRKGEIVLVEKWGVAPTRKRRTLLQSIVLIQSHVRRMIARDTRRKKMKALLKIQRAARAFRVRSIYSKILSAIIFIQAVWRGYQGRKYARSILPKGVVALVQSHKRWRH